MQLEGEPLEMQLQVLQAWYTFCAAKLRVFKVWAPQRRAPQLHHKTNIHLST